MRTNSNETADRAQSASSDAVKRRPFLTALGGLALVSGVLGRAGAADDAAWPDPDDEFYAGLIDELSALDIAPGLFVYAQNEAETFAAYELGGANAEIGDRSSLDVSEDDVPFTEATRIQVGELEDGALDPWGVTLQASVEDQGVSSGDALLGVAFLRTPDIANADVTYKSTEAANEDANYALNGGVSVGQEWERYFFPIDFQSDGDASDWWTEFWVGVEGRTVDVGGLAVLDFGQDADANELPSWDDELDLPDDWEDEADDRIRSNRTADLTVEVADADGNTVDADVALDMCEHEFTFGTAVDANRLQAEGDGADQYRDLIPELFNAAVLENHHKWRFFEESQDAADDATEWVLDQDLAVRGHACLWANQSAYAVPADVEDAMAEGDAETVHERTHDHVETVVDHYGDDVLHWDVVNEVIHEPEMIDLIDGDDVDPVEAPALEEWYQTATEAAPDGVELDVNDYNTLAGPYEGTRADYERQIEFLADADGVDLGGIGMQSHFSRGEQLTPPEIVDALDRYAAAGDGAALRITEFDMADPNWLEADKAEFFHWFLKTVFSHPDVEDFLMWGFWDDEHWQDDAPLFDGDWDAKPSYDVYTDLVFDEWWTEEHGSTADGAFTTRAFLGEHELTVAADGTETDLQTTLSIDEPAEQSIEITLVDIEVLGGENGNGRIPVRIHEGDSFDPDELDDESVRFGDPELVGDGGGSEVQHRPGANGQGRGQGGGRGGGNGSQQIHFDADASELEDGVAMLAGRTDDGSVVVGVDQY